MNLVHSHINRTVTNDTNTGLEAMRLIPLPYSEYIRHFSNQTRKYASRCVVVNSDRADTAPVGLLGLANIIRPALICYAARFWVGTGFKMYIVPTPL